MKGWQVYRDIEDLIKDMGIVLPLINDLHSPAMRGRHWASLAKICHVKAVDPTDAKFTLDDMMALSLHKHVEVCSICIDICSRFIRIARLIGA